MKENLKYKEKTEVKVHVTTDTSNGNIDDWEKMIL